MRIGMISPSLCIKGVGEAAHWCYDQVRRLALKVKEAVISFCLWITCSKKLDPSRIALPLPEQMKSDFIAMGDGDFLSKYGKTLKAADLTALIGRFPDKGGRIGQIAITWKIGEKGNYRPDPQHPFYEIFQALNSCEKDLEDDQVIYIGNALLGFQELSRKENEELIRVIAGADLEKAYLFASVVFGVAIKPDDKEASREDLLRPIHDGVAGLWDLYLEVRAQGKLVPFFEKAFHRANTCFVGQIGQLNEFKGQLLLGEPDPDFVLEVMVRDPIPKKVVKYFEFWRNTQIRDFCEGQDPPLAYKPFQTLVVSGVDPKTTELADLLHVFNQSFRLENFQKYLMSVGESIEATVVRPLVEDSFQT